MNEHVGKPFDLDNLVHTLLRVTGYVVPELVQAQLPVAAAAPAIVAVEVAQVDGLDVAGAVDRMDGLTSLYGRLAQQFLETLEVQLAELQSAIRVDRAQATLLAHTLKGTAGVLGATHLSQAAAALEKLCKSGEADDAALQAEGRHVEEVAKALAPLMQAALKKFAGAQPVAHQAETVHTAGQALVQAMAELKPLVAAEDFSVLQKFAELRTVLAELPEALFSPLEEALQDLDMQGAQQACAAIDDWIACLPVT
jgi:HPt (histidine-containing phosphotransfer) domain-containing protein